MSDDNETFDAPDDGSDRPGGASDPGDRRPSGQSAFRPPWSKGPENGPGPGPSEPMQVAGFGWRAAGFLIDAILVTVVTLMIAAASGLPTLALLIVEFVIGTLYPALTIARWNGHTIGMGVFGLRCVDAVTWTAVPLTQALVRAVTAQLINTIGLIIRVGVVAQILDLLWPLWDANNQTLHDKVARTMVLRTPSLATGGWVRSR